MDDLDLKKTLKAVDLALAAGRKRQSAKTGFVHAFATDDLALDTIPIYENFCFALALFRKKTSETILEGKELLERLFAFQTEDGNFPIYLHDFPKCWDFHLSLKIAPILIHILREFGAILKEDFKHKLENCLERAVIPPKSPSWEHRFLACKGILPVCKEPLSSHQDWFEWIVSMQLLDLKKSHFVPYHVPFQMFLGDPLIQEKERVAPLALEYCLAEKTGFHSRLIEDHLQQLHSAVLFPFSSLSEDFSDVLKRDFPPSLFWRSEGRIHSLCIHGGKWKGPDQILFDLASFPELGRSDLFEASLYCNLAEDLSISINGKKGMVFSLKDVISIKTKTTQIDLSFELLEGNGDFLGHLSRGNRPNQIGCKKELLYHAYDWHIGLRTLRRDPSVKIGLNIHFCQATEDSQNAT
jgi:hypothetical protein